LFQAIGLIIQSVINFRQEKVVADYRVIIGTLLMAFNIYRIIDREHASIADSTLFAILCGFLATSYLSRELKSNFQLLFITTINAIIFLAVLAMTFRIDQSSTYSRILIISIALVLYVIVILIIHLIRRNANQVTRIDFFDFIHGVVFIFAAFGALLVENAFSNGLYTSNLIFIGLVSEDLLKLIFAQNSNTVLDNDDDAYLFGDEMFLSKKETFVELGEARFLKKFKEFGFTSRQSEVALLLLTRMSRQEIADQLGIKIGTIGPHCNQIFKKSDTESRVDFVLKMKKIAEQTSH